MLFPSAFDLSPDNKRLRFSMLQLAIELGYHLPVPIAWPEDLGFSSCTTKLSCFMHSLVYGVAIVVLCC